METVIFAALAEQTWQADPKRMTVMTDQFAGRGNNCQGNWSLTPTGMTRRKRTRAVRESPGASRDCSRVADSPSGMGADAGDGETGFDST